MVSKLIYSILAMVVFLYLGTKTTHLDCLSEFIHGRRMHMRVIVVSLSVCLSHENMELWKFTQQNFLLWTISETTVIDS